MAFPSHILVFIVILPLLSCLFRNGPVLQVDNHLLLEALLVLGSTFLEL